MSSYKRSILQQVFLTLVCVAFASLIVLPILYCFDLSFFTKKEYYAWPPKFLPGSLNLDNYRDALAYAPFFRYILNSMIVSVGRLRLCDAKIPWKEPPILSGALHNDDPHADGYDCQLSDHQSDAAAGHIRGIDGALLRIRLLRIQYAPSLFAGAPQHQGSRGH